MATEQYNRVSHRDEQDTMEKLGRSMDAVTSSLATLAAECDARLKATKGRFNLFTVLWPRHYEVQLHSRYLAHLLQPQAESSDASHHDCGELFLKLFLDTLKRTMRTHGAACESWNPDVLDRFDCRAATTTREKVTRHGNIDILIECPTWGAIVIENKIWAGDQDDQLARYSAFLLEEYANRGQKALLLYLTLDGHPSGRHIADPYLRISYADHILPWLDECLRATYQHININQALQQYRTVVRQLLGLMEEDQMAEVRDIVEKHPAIIRHFAEIGQAVESIRTRYYNLYFDRIREKIANNGIEICKGPDPDCSSLYWDIQITRKELVQNKLYNSESIGSHFPCGTTV